MPSRSSDHAEVTSFATATHFDVEVMRTWYRKQAFARHTHPYFTLGTMLRGVGTLWSAGETSTLRTGDIVLIPPGEVHTGGLDDRAGVLSYVALHVPPGLVAQAADSWSVPVSAVESFSTTIFRDARLAQGLRQVDAGIGRARDAAAVETDIIAAIDLLVSRHCGMAKRATSPTRGRPPFVDVTRTVIEDCYADNGRTSLGSLAAVAGVSAFHLVREFKRALGLSPHQYVVQTRVRRAAELLARGLPISDTAATVGFADQSHLTTHFKRYVGVTPASWQRSAMSKL